VAIWDLPEALGQAAWSQRLDTQGRSRTQVRMANGQRLQGEQIGAVWNRARLLPQARFRASAAVDQDYAGAELQALVVSWLAELGPRVVPPMRRHALLTPALHPLHWAVAAGQCGLTLAPRADTPAQHLVLRTPLGLSGPGTPAWSVAQTQASHALAERRGLPLLELGFSGPAHAPLLCSVNPHPSLASAAAVAATLARAARGGKKP